MSLQKKSILIFSITTILLGICISTLRAQKGYEDYIQRHKSIAIAEAKRSGVPASITLAQAIHESNVGKSRLAREGNNHFGIKCHSEWTAVIKWWFISKYYFSSSQWNNRWLFIKCGLDNV